MAQARSQDRITLERERRIAASGMLPLDFMLAVARDVSLPLPVRIDAAKAAAPFVHPRLAAIEHSGIEQSGSLALRSASETSDDELAAIVARQATAEVVN